MYFPFRKYMTVPPMATAPGRPLAVKAAQAEGPDRRAGRPSALGTPADGRRGRGSRAVRLATRALGLGLLHQGSRAGLAFWARVRACWENQPPAAGSVKTELVARLQSGSNVWKAALELLGQPAMGAACRPCRPGRRTLPAASHCPSD